MSAMVRLSADVTSISSQVIIHGSLVVTKVEN